MVLCFSFNKCHSSDDRNRSREL